MTDEQLKVAMTTHDRITVLMQEPTFSNWDTDPAVGLAARFREISRLASVAAQQLDPKGDSSDGKN